MLLEVGDNLDDVLVLIDLNSVESVLRRGVGTNANAEHLDVPASTVEQLALKDLQLLVVVLSRHLAVRVVHDELGDLGPTLDRLTHVLQRVAVEVDCVWAELAKVLAFDVRPRLVPVLHDVHVKGSASVTRAVLDVDSAVSDDSERDTHALKQVRLSHDRTLEQDHRDAAVGTADVHAEHDCVVLLPGLSLVLEQTRVGYRSTLAQRLGRHLPRLQVARNLASTVVSEHGAHLEQCRSENALL